MKIQLKPYHGLFGLRLSQSLHFGHIVGNIRPAISDQNERIIVVVLADLFTYTSDRRDDILLDNILSMTAESMALGLNSQNVKYVIQSNVFSNLLPLYTILSCLLKFDKLKATKPINKMLEKEQNINFGELSFPIIQCAEMVSTKSEILYSNTDNLGIVSLTKYLFRKIQNYTNTPLPKPTLIHGDFPNVKGVDHNKMSQSRGNALCINDSEQTIENKIVSVDTSINPKKEIDLSLIYDYFKIVGYSADDINTLKQKFNNQKMTALTIKKLLVSEINKYLSTVRKEKNKFLQNKEELLDRIKSDTVNIKNIVDSNVNIIFKNFYNSEFFENFKT